MPNTKSFLLAFTVILLSALVSNTNACTCGRISACEAYANASVVFVGLVTKTGVRKTQVHFPSNAMSTTVTSSTSAASFNVEEAFRGVEVTEIEISGEGTTCDYYFKQGERYLIYAHPSNDGKTFHTNICSGTKPLSEAKDDLTYLHSVGKLSTGGTIFGEIKREISRTGKGALSPEPIRKAEIILERGDQSFKAVSDANGNFELSGIPQGHYKVRTNPQTNFSRADVMAEEPRHEWELDIPGHGCIKTWFLARPEGEISGTVIDDSGIVPEDAEPELIPVNEKITNSDVQGVKLGDGRSFKFSFLPPGRYYLGFNLLSGPSISEPYPEFYYPGVEDKSKATIITLGEGQKVTGLYLQRPPRLAERMIEGIAVWPDGRPFTDNCGIQLVNPRTGYREGNCVSPDARGHFIIKAIEGQTYELSATLPGRKSIALVSSKPILIKVGKENRSVRLIAEYRQ